MDGVVVVLALDQVNRNMDREADNDMAEDNDMDSRHDEDTLRMKRKAKDRQQSPWAGRAVHRMWAEMKDGDDVVALVVVK